MTTSPAILTRGGRTPVSCSTAHSSSRPTIPCSTSRLSSSAKALSTAASNSSQSVTFVTPTDDPARVGLTKTGSPSSCTRAIHVSRVDSASGAPPPPRAGGSPPPPGGGAPRPAPPHRSAQGHPGCPRNPRRDQHRLCHVFVHPDRRGKHPVSHIRQTEQLKHSLDRAILAEPTVQDRENHVNLAE